MIGARRRSVATLFATLVATLSLAGPALAVGVSGIEIRLELPRQGNLRVIEVGEEAAALSFDLENIEDEPRTVRLYAATAEITETGAVSVGRVDSAPFMGIEDQLVTVEPGQSVTIETLVDPRQIPEDESANHNGAIVIESVDNGETLVTRAAVVVTVAGEGLPPLRAVTVLIAAVVIMLFTMAAAGRTVRSNRRKNNEAESAADVDREFAAV